jgi:hypothetical protein
MEGIKHEGPVIKKRCVDHVHTTGRLAWGLATLASLDRVVTVLRVLFSRSLSLLSTFVK